MTSDSDNNELKQIKQLLAIFMGILGLGLIAWGAGAFNNDQEIKIIPIETTTTSTP